MATRMQQRRGTAADWAAQNPVLADGEVGFETDTKVLKMGDGVTAWNDLIMPYLTAGGGTMTGPLTVVEPTNPNHAARLVDAQDAAAGVAAGRVLKAGDTMTGRLTVNNATHQQHFHMVRGADAVNLTVGNPSSGPAAEFHINAALAFRAGASLSQIFSDLNVDGVINSDNPRVFVQSSAPTSGFKINDLWGW